jgi:hypothetical protein
LTACRVKYLSGWLEIPAPAGLEVRGLGHGECRGEVYE